MLAQKVSLFQYEDLKRGAQLKTKQFLNNKKFYENQYLEKKSFQKKLEEQKANLLLFRDDPSLNVFPISYDKQSIDLHNSEIKVVNQEIQETQRFISDLQMTGNLKLRGSIFPNFFFFNLFKFFFVQTFILS